jgi:hypothetical protein
VDNAAGHINFSATKFADPYPSGGFRAATVRFRAKAVTAGTAVTLARTAVRWTLEGMASEEINARWQDFMAPHLENLSSAHADESMIELGDVFHLD